MERLTRALIRRALTRRTYRPRRCDNCGEPYGRRNLYEAWVNQNPGHLTGWRKVLLRICTRCQNQNRTMRGLVMVEASISHNHHPRRAAS